jgi:3',5'-nucleoside bisphosphate phosphatase
VIDLHLHTTASDGLLAPDALVARAASAGLHVISITDHDTTAGLAAAGAAAAERGLRLVPGIEITAVERGRDVHVLGYFFDPASASLATFLRVQRADRVQRVREMAERLRSLGCVIDEESILARASGTGRSVGRPALADALVAAGHAADREDAFARWLGHGRPAFVPRRGASGGHVIGLIHAAGGVASLAHPGVLARDDLIPRLASAGLDALEVWHSDHDARQREHYAGLADDLGLAMSGGSDYHGEGVHRAAQIGTVTLPSGEFARLEASARSRQATSATRGTAGIDEHGPAV